MSKNCEPSYADFAWNSIPLSLFILRYCSPSKAGIAVRLSRLLLFKKFTWGDLITFTVLAIQADILWSPFQAKSAAGSEPCKEKTLMTFVHALMNPFAVLKIVMPILTISLLHCWKCSWNFWLYSFWPKKQNMEFTNPAQYTCMRLSHWVLRCTLLQVLRLYWAALRQAVILQNEDSANWMTIWHQRAVLCYMQMIYCTTAYKCSRLQRTA